MQWWHHKSLLLNFTFRICQIAGATACLALYAPAITAATKQDKYLDTKWMYAVVVSALALTTSVIYFATGFLIEFRAIAILFAWEWILMILWVAVAGIFGTMYQNEKAEMDEGIRRMKIAVGFDIANVGLWLLTAIYATYIYWINKGDLLHRGRTKPKVTVNENVEMSTR